MHEVIVQCAWCKRVRKDDLWVEVSENEISGRLVSHGICENCCSILEDDEIDEESDDTR